MDKILVGFWGTVLILFVTWFFFGKRFVLVPAAEKEDLQEIDVTVDGGYKPDSISLKRGKKATIRFNRKDPSSCLEEVVLGNFGVKKKLPLNEVVEVEIMPEKAGEFDFSCGMGMFHGKIVVRG